MGKKSKAIAVPVDDGAAQTEVADDRAGRPYQLVEAPVGMIEPGDNARRDFDEGDLAELARSLRDSGGAIQPGRAWRNEWGVYVLITGERRWRAHHLAGLPRMWLMVGPRPSVAEMKKWNLVENLQRANLRPLETCRRVAEMLGMRDDVSGLPLWSQATLAEELGKSLTWVAECLAAMAAPPETLAALDAGAVSVSVAGLVGSLPEPMRARAQAEMVLRPFGGAMSAPEAARHVAEHFRRDLRRADFNGEDGDLVRGCPRCSECEWNGANRADVGGRAKGSVCLNPACFEEKARAHAARRRERESDTVGVTVLEAGVAERIFQPWNGAVDPSSGYVDVNDRPDAYLLTESARLADRESLPRWEQLCDGAEVAIKIAFDAEGRERRLVETKPATLAALRSRWAGLFKGGADEGLLTADEKKEAAAVRRAVDGARRSVLVEGCGEFLDRVRGLFVGGRSVAIAVALEPADEWETARALLGLAVEGNLQREDIIFLSQILAGDLGAKGATLDEVWAVIEGDGRPGLVLAVLALVLRLRAIRHRGFSGPDWEPGAPLSMLAAAGGFAVAAWEEKLERRVKAAEAKARKGAEA